MIKNLSVKKLLVVLIVSLPLTGMTQLRFNCCAYGPGELLLSVWVICSLFILRSERVNPFENDTARVISWFWLLSIIVMAIGAYFGHSLYPWDYLSKPINHYLFHSPIHDAIAYVSLMLLTITLASCKYTRQELLTAFVAVAIISAVFMYGLLMMKYFGISTGSFRLVGSNVARFAGLANNPNQAALLIIFVPFLITAYIENNGARLSSAQKFGLALVLAVSWLIGLETRSTAFKVSILVWFAIILFFWLRLIVRKNKLLNPAIKILFLSILLAAGLNNIHKPFVEIEQERTRKFVKTLNSLKTTEVLKTSPAESLKNRIKTHENAFEFHDKWSDTLYVPHKSDFNFPGDFTVELWFLTPLEGGEHRLFSHWGDGGYIGGYGNGKIFAGARNLKGIHVGVLYSAIPAPNVWHHFAYTRSGSTYRLFIDGKEADSVIEEKADNLTLETPFYVGSQKEKLFWKGLIDGTIVISGQARYTKDFTPSTDTIEDNLIHKPKIIDEPNVKQEKNSKTHILRPSWFAYMKGRFQSESIRLIETIIEKSEPRFVLYKNGFRALSHSPIVGLGPGPYSGDDGPFEKREVHNSFVDWIVNTGIIGGIAMLALFFWSACRLLSAHCYSLFCGFMGMCLFAQFHHVIRHPIVWIFLILALKIADLKSMNLET